MGTIALRERGSGPAFHLPEKPAAAAGARVRAPLLPSRSPTPRRTQKRHLVLAIPGALVEEQMQASPRSISGSSRSDCRSQPPHRELDLPAWRFAPMLDLAHVGRLRVAIEELPHRLAGVVTGLGEGLLHETIAGAVLRAMIAHPIRQLTRGLGPCHRCYSI